MHRHNLQDPAEIPSAVTKPSNLDRLTGLRFFAALLVVVHHGTLDLTPLPALRPLASTGYVGVTFFFILSGFVLTWSGSPQLRPRHFYGRRFARIYPTHAVAFLIALALSAMLSLPIGMGPAATNLTLTQSWVPISAFTERLNNVSWSLVDEAFFYGLVPLLFVRWLRLKDYQLLVRIAATLLALVLSGLLVHQLLGAETAGNLLYKFPPFRVGEFLVGMALALIVKRGWRCPVGVGPAAVFVVYVYVAMSGGCPYVVCQAASWCSGS